MQCKAYSRRNHARCRNPAMRGREVCRMHGGATPIGAGLPQFKTGKYSRFLPARMAATYNEARRDPKLLELRDAIATVDARIIDVLKRVDTGEAGAIWREAQAAMAKFRVEQARNHVEGMMLAITHAERLITKGAGDYAAWVEISQLIEQRRKLVESEQRRVSMAAEILTAEQAMVLLSAVVATIQKHVTDRAVLGAISADLVRLGTMDQPTSTPGSHAGNGHVPPDDGPMFVS